MIKILFVMNYIKNGGPSRVVLNIINNLDKSKYEVNILTLKDKNDNKIVELLYNQNVNVIQLNYSKNSSVIVNIHKIRRIIKQLNIDIAHSHGLLPDIIISNEQDYKLIIETDKKDILQKNYQNEGKSNIKNISFNIKNFFDENDEHLIILLLDKSI